MTSTMKIELLKTTPDRAGRYFLKFESGETMRLYRQTVEDHGLYSGKELSAAELTALREDAGKMSARMRAVRIVSAASVSKKDLEQRLVQKGEDPAQAKDAVDWMSGLDLLDDRKVAEQVVSRCASRGYGPARAKQALYEKKIPKQYWEEALADYPDQQEYMVSFLQNRLGESYDAKDIKRAVDALLRRGHSYGSIRRALGRLADTEEILEE